MKLIRSLISRAHISLKFKVPDVSTAFTEFWLQTEGSILSPTDN